jgi:tetratricopeptide (TPR) repeat protein
MFEKAEKVSSEWGDDWKYHDFYTYFANACHNAGKSDKEAKVLEIGLKLFPDDYELIWGQAKLALSKGNSKRVQELINNYEYLCKRSGISESEIEAKMGSLFEEVDSLNRAEYYFREALALEPDDAMMMNNLAYLLIDKGRNINEGLELIDKALNIRPDDYIMLNTKGWGLYKQGKFKEALQLLEKSWDLTPSYAWRGTYLHLEAAKKAIANQK